MHDQYTVSTLVRRGTTAIRSTVASCSCQRHCWIEGLRMELEHKVNHWSFMPCHCHRHWPHPGVRRSEIPQALVTLRPSEVCKFCTFPDNLDAMAPFNARQSLNAKTSKGGTPVEREFDVCSNPVYMIDAGRAKRFHSFCRDNRGHAAKCTLSPGRVPDPPALDGTTTI